MLAFDMDPDFFHRQNHFGADVLLRIEWWHRKVTFLVARLVSQIWAFVGSGIPASLFGIDIIIRLIFFLIKLDVIKNKKFRFGPKIGGIPNAALSYIFFCLVSDVARVFGIALFCDRIINIANKTQSRFL